jgi:hypothetical protein
MLSGLPRWVLPALAAALAAVGLALWLRVARLHGLDSRAAGSAVANSAGDWPVEKPPVPETVPPTVGTLPSSTDGYAQAALVAALEPYRRDDFAGAAMSLEGFVATHSESAEGWYYLGASRLLSGDPRRARAAFDRAYALNARVGHPELQWLAATAEARTGAIESARTKLQALCATPNQLQVRACAAEESLKR